MKKIVTAGLCLALLSGCATQTYVLSPTSQSNPAFEEDQTFFVNGIGQEQSVDAAKVCGGADKVAKIETQLSPLNALFAFVAQGIYTPRNIKVYCK